MHVAYRWYFGAHSLKALKRNILGFLGVAPMRDTLIGAIETMDDASRAKWVDRLRDRGRQAAWQAVAQRSCELGQQRDAVRTRSTSCREARAAARPGLL